MTSLEERYKKAYANFEKAAAEYYPLLDAHREAMYKGKRPGLNTPLQTAYDKFQETIVPERALDQKLRDRLLRDVDKMPLPLDVRKIVKEYLGPLNEARTELPVTQAAKTMKYTGGRASRKTRKNRKTRRRRV